MKEITPSVIKGHLPRHRALSKDHPGFTQGPRFLVPFPAFWNLGQTELLPDLFARYLGGAEPLGLESERLGAKPVCIAPSALPFHPLLPAGWVCTATCCGSLEPSSGKRQSAGPTAGSQGVHLLPSTAPTGWRCLGARPGLSSASGAKQSPLRNMKLGPTW